MNLLSKKIGLIFILMIVTTFSSQEISELRYQNIINQLKVKKSQIKEDLVAEKKMPNAENSYIVVIPILIGKYEWDSFTVKNTILITDEIGTIKNKFSDPHEYYSDAMMLQNFSIDTGIYTLNFKTRAFGISASYRNGSQPNPASNQDISLYVPTGKTLKNILNKYQIYRSGAEWDLKCAGESTEENSVIIIEKAKTNGFANLIFKTEITDIVSEEVNGECVENKSSKIVYKVLKYNQSVYQ